MKSTVGLIAASVLCAAMALAQGIAQPRHYVVTDLGTLPGETFIGESNYATFVTNNGLIAGQITLLDGTYDAVLWRNGTVKDLGRPGLGGPNSWPFAVNEKGQVAGFAEASTPDPNGEDFCGFGTNLVCLPFLWQDGAMFALPTLGGANGATDNINNSGEVVGWAENTTPDPGCPAPQVLQFKPVIWKNGGIQELDTYPGDPEGVALGINAKGEVVGGSGSCEAYNASLTYLMSTHALAWLNGAMVDLGSLGGAGTNQGIIAWDINNKGEIVGNSDMPGDLESHAFLWTREKGMQDLGVFPGDKISFGLAINESGEIVGASMKTLSYSDIRAVVWVNGKPVDLNSLLVQGGIPGLYIGFVDSINSSGEMVGWGIESNGDLHAVLLTPVVGVDAASLVPAEPVVLSEEGRRKLNRPMRLGRLGGRMTGSR